MQNCKAYDDNYKVKSLNYLCRCGALQLSGKAVGKQETASCVSGSAKTSSSTAVQLFVSYVFITFSTVCKLQHFSAKDKGYFHSSGHKETVQCCVTHVYSEEQLVWNKGTPSPSFWSFGLAGSLYLPSAQPQLFLFSIVLCFDETSAAEFLLGFPH